jgi:hypothetical protein
MVNTNAVAADLVANSGVIDDMEASTDVFGAEDLVFLAAYQAKLASTRTNLTEDMTFIAMLARYMVVKSPHT